VFYAGGGGGGNRCSPCGTSNTGGTWWWFWSNLEELECISYWWNSRNVQIQAVEVEEQVFQVLVYSAGAGGSGIVIIRAPGSCYIFSSTRN
jgi:hypothetical protein